MRQWRLIVCQIIIIVLFLGTAFLHVVDPDSNLLNWELVAILSAGSLPFLLPLLSVYVKGVGKEGITFHPPIPAELKALPEASQSVSTKTECLTIADSKPSDWTNARAVEYGRVHGYMLAHVYKRRRSDDQEFSVFIFLVRHEKGTSGPPKKHFEEIEKLEFFFGSSWSNQVFSVPNTGGVIGVRTEAWGTFLATCRVSFRDSKQESIVLHRYIDFHMLQQTSEEVY